MKKAIVYSSHGEIVIDSDTGKVLEVNPFESPDPDFIRGYKDVTFDLAEYYSHYKMKVGSEDTFDVLDLGFYEKDKYLPADKGFRELFREDLEKKRNKKKKGG